MTCEGWIGSDWHANVHHRLVGEFRLTIERIGDGWTWAVSVRVVGGTGRYNLAVADHYEDTMERAAEVCEIAARRRGIMVPPSTDEAIAGRAREAALQAEVERLTADDNTAADQFRVAIEEHLPEYALSSNDADLANHVERIEYAGEEIKRLTRDLAAARADAATCRQVATEAIDDLEHHRTCGYERGVDGAVVGCDCYLATLRARIAALNPGAERARED